MSRDEEIRVRLSAAFGPHAPDTVEDLIPPLTLTNDAGEFVAVTAVRVTASDGTKGLAYVLFNEEVPMTFLLPDGVRLTV